MDQTARVRICFFLMSGDIMMGANRPAEQRFACAQFDCQLFVFVRELVTGRLYRAVIDVDVTIAAPDADADADADAVVLRLRLGTA